MTLSSTLESSKACQTMSKLEWESVTCNLCGNDQTKSFHKETLPYFDQTISFNIDRCTQCNLVYTNPRLSDYNAVYLFGPSEEANEVESHADAKSPIFISAITKILRWQQKCGQNGGGKILDLGCGSGHFLCAAQNNGFVGTGIEPSTSSAHYAKQKGVNVLHVDMYQANLPENSFDVITAFDVLEHVSDPKQMLTLCHKWLKPGGILVLRFPSSTWQKIKGVILHNILSSSRPSFAPTMHLYFFSVKTIEKMTTNIGFDTLLIETTDTETNSSSQLLNGIKLVSNFVVKSIEMVSRKLLGNLEVYCQKPVHNDTQHKI